MNLNYLELPLLEHKDKIRYKDTKEGTQLFDVIRRKWIKSLPEELVRQLTVHYLNQELGFDYRSINVEKRIVLNGFPKRFDVVAYRHAEPMLLVECKSFQHELRYENFVQLANYNQVLKASYVLLTNGPQSLLFDRAGANLDSMNPIIDQCAS